MYNYIYIYCEVIGSIKGNEFMQYIWKCQLLLCKISLPITCRSTQCVCVCLKFNALPRTTKLWMCECCATRLILSSNYFFSPYRSESRYYCSSSDGWTITTNGPYCRGYSCAKKTKSHSVIFIPHLPNTRYCLTIWCSSLMLLSWLILGYGAWCKCFRRTIIITAN